MKRCADHECVRKPAKSMFSATLSKCVVKPVCVEKPREPVMNSEIALALFRPGEEPVKSEEDIIRLHALRIAGIEDGEKLALYERAKLQLVRDIASLCGNLGKSREVVWQAKAVPKILAASPALPTLKTSPALPMAALPALETSPALPMPALPMPALPKKVPKSKAAKIAKLDVHNCISDEMKKLFAEKFQESPGSHLFFVDIFDAFVRSRGMVTKFEESLFKLHCKTLFLAQWPNAKHCVYDKKRCYDHVSVKK